MIRSASIPEKYLSYEGRKILLTIQSIEEECGRLQTNNEKINLLNRVITEINTIIVDIDMAKYDEAKLFGKTMLEYTNFILRAMRGISIPIGQKTGKGYWESLLRFAQIKIDTIKLQNQIDPANTNSPGMDREKIIWKDSYDCLVKLFSELIDNDYLSGEVVASGSKLTIHSDYLDHHFNIQTKYKNDTRDQETARQFNDHYYKNKNSTGTSVENSYFLWKETKTKLVLLNIQLSEYGFFNIEEVAPEKKGSDKKFDYRYDWKPISDHFMIIKNNSIKDLSNDNLGKLYSASSSEYRNSKNWKLVKSIIEKVLPLSNEKKTNNLLT